MRRQRTSRAIENREGKWSMSKSSSTCFVPRPAIALDLDETLIYSTPIRPKALSENRNRQNMSKIGQCELTETGKAVEKSNSLITFSAKEENVNSIFSIRVHRRRLYVQTRPNLREFLRKLSKTYDIFIFTSSSKEYANAVVDKIMPEIRDCRCLFRDSCIDLNGYSVKDLDLLRRPLAQTLLLDDMAGSALKNPDNLIKIDAWTGKSDDNALLGELLPVLERIAFENDIGLAYKEAIKAGKFEKISTF